MGFFVVGKFILLELFKLSFCFLSIYSSKVASMWGHIVYYDFYLCLVFRIICVLNLMSITIDTLHLEYSQIVSMVTDPQVSFIVMCVHTGQLSLSLSLTYTNNNDLLVEWKMKHNNKSIISGESANKVHCIEMWCIRSMKHVLWVCVYVSQCSGSV